MPNWLPENISTYGGEIDHVFALIFYTVGFWFVLTEVLILYFVIRYRRRPGRRAAHVTGETLTQASWILIPALIVMGLDFWIDAAGGKAWERVMIDSPAADVQVEVKAKQFNWEMLYPGVDGLFGTADDFRLENELHVPVDQVVRLGLTSEDVIHSLFLPTVRLKMDILPGRSGETWFEATKPGRYELACAELCGVSHYTMRGWLTVHPPEEYEQWLREQGEER